MAREGRRAKTALVPGAEAGAGLAPGGDCGTAESGELEDRTGRRINRRRERAGERSATREARGCQYMARSSPKSSQLPVGLITGSSRSRTKRQASGSFDSLPHEHEPSQSLSLASPVLASGGIGYWVGMFRGSSAGGLRGPLCLSRQPRLWISAGGAFRSEEGA